MTSILNTIKKMLMIEEDDTTFDADITVHINSAILPLTQNGIGPADGFFITGATETWEQFLGVTKLLEAVKSYIYLKVRIIFDPPNTSYVIEAFNRSADEMLARLNIQVDPPYIPPEVPDDE